MRLRIPDEIIELARIHPESKVELYWAAVAYVLHWEMIYHWLADILDPNKRRSKKMEWNSNSAGHTVKQSGTDCINRVGQTVPKNSVGHSIKSKSKPTKKEISDEALTIYIGNNNILYDIVYRYIQSNIHTWNIQYLINKQWEQKYIYSQMLEAEKVIKQVWLETFTTILAYVKQDDFWSKQILSIAKLNRKNKDGVPYWIVIMDKIKDYSPKVVSIPTV